MNISKIISAVVFLSLTLQACKSEKKFDQNSLSTFDITDTIQDVTLQDNSLVKVLFVGETPDSNIHMGYYSHLIITHADLGDTLNLLCPFVYDKEITGKTMRYISGNSYAYVYLILNHQMRYQLPDTTLPEIHNVISDPDIKTHKAEHRPFLIGALAKIETES